MAGGKLFGVVVRSGEHDMRAFAEAWLKEPFVQQVFAQIPWGYRDLGEPRSPSLRSPDSLACVMVSSS